MDSNETPDVDAVDAAIADAKEAAQHLRDVAPGAIDDPEPHEDIADEAADDGSETAEAPDASPAP